MAEDAARRRVGRVLLAVALVGSAAAGVIVTASPAHATAFTFSTGVPDGAMAMASHPVNPSGPDTEAADDFILTSPTVLTGASFTGLLPLGTPPPHVLRVLVEI